MNASKVFIQSVGLVSPMGEGVDAFYRSIRENRSAVENSFARIDWNDAEFIERRNSFCRNNELDRGLSKASYISLLAIQECFPERVLSEVSKDIDALYLGTTTGRVDLWEGEFKIDPRYKIMSVSSLLGEVKAAIGFRGHEATFGSACAASSNALGVAQLAIASGRCQNVLVGGVELLCDLTCSGFQSLGLVSPDPCRPFDVSRKGINLAEASCWMHLSARSEGALAELLSFGMGSDGFHLTSPEPNGAGLQRAMEISLGRAGIKKSQIDWVHAHGTGSRANDVAESKALLSFFGESCPPVSSTKWHHGHALGASGILESALCIESLCSGDVFSNSGISQIDSEIGVPIVKEVFHEDVQYVMKNTLGFGGVNTSLIFGRSS